MSLKETFQSPYFNGISGISSILGLLITFWVLRNVRRIKSFYTKTIRLPQLIEKLQVNAKNILESMGVKNNDALLIELGKAEENLKALSKKSNANIKLQCKNNILEIAAILKKGEVTIVEVRKIHTSIHKIIAATDNLQDDLSLER